ncbi:hypothetical protein FIBSPDRAFT_91512 [Athelia psychrophila]|uniref:Uncharacterized protein n=1 Tax=Athelia psychrophila TaxID=1759441 RepID=A0A166TIR2_9AGAM|nr:hypothetical protein FIBSPDRAFT_91512 [Fibularhizoctonia sp. CBS 109695]
MLCFLRRPRNHSIGASNNTRYEVTKHLAGVLSFSRGRSQQLHCFFPTSFHSTMADDVPHYVPPGDPPYASVGSTSSRRAQ